MTRLTPTISRRLRRLLPAALIAATAVLGASAFGAPGIAGAAPEWDIEAYDKCVAQADTDLVNGKISGAVHEERVRNCCPDSGGVSIPGVPAYAACRAPAAAPGRTIPPGIPTQTLAPDLPFAPPGDITQTFTPAP